MKNIIPILLITSVLIIHKTYADEPTQKELKIIAETYIEAFEDSDYDRLSRLFVAPHQLNKRLFNNYTSWIRKMKLRKLDENNLLIETQLKSEYIFHDYRGTRDLNNTERWLILTSTGKIKYDSLLLKHPVEEAYLKMKELRYYHRCAKKKAPPNKALIRDAQKSLNDLRRLGVPVYDLDVNKGTSNVEGELKKIIAWLKENGKNWDTSEPKVTFPEALYKKYKSSPW